MNRYLTPAQLAKLAGVHPTTILKAIQAGRIEVQNTPGGHHRIARAAAEAFLESLGISTATLHKRKVRVLVITPDADLGRAMVERRNGRYEVEVADHLMAAGVAIGRFNPDIVVADGRMDGLLAAESLALLRPEPRSKVVALADLSNSTMGTAVNAWVADPRDVEAIFARVTDLARSTDVWSKVSA